MNSLHEWMTSMQGAWYEPVKFTRQCLPLTASVL